MLQEYTHLAMSPGLVAALLIGGMIAGMINAVAGGGSLISLPLLIFAGLPPTVANGSNRIAVVIQSLISSGTYARHGQLSTDGLRACLPPLLLGAALGAGLAAGLSNEAFRPILAVLLLVLGALVLLKPNRWLHPRPTPLPRWLIFAFWLLTGFHGGFIQAGVGFSFLATAVLAVGMDLVRANALKLVAVALFSAMSLAVFAWHGQVDWIAGATLAVGNGVGGYLGARLAMLKGAPWIRWVLVITVVLSAGRMLLS